MEDSWIKHNGQGLPVAAHDMVEVRYANGGLLSDFAEEFFWRNKPENHPLAFTNIIAYRLKDNKSC